MVNLTSGKSTPEGNLPHKTIESGRDLGVSYELLLFFVDLPNGQWPCDRNVFLKADFHLTFFVRVVSILRPL